MKKIILIFCATIALASCTTSPLDKKVNKEKPDKDFTELKEVLEKDEYNMLTSFFFLKGVGGKDMSSQTYRELLEEAKQFTKEQEEKNRIKKEQKGKEHERIAREFLEQEGYLEKK